MNGFLFLAGFWLSWVIFADAHIAPEKINRSASFCETHGGSEYVAIYTYFGEYSVAGVKCKDGSFTESKYIFSGKVKK